MHSRRYSPACYDAYYSSVCVCAYACMCVCVYFALLEILPRRFHQPSRCKLCANVSIISRRRASAIRKTFPFVNVADSLRACSGLPSRGLAAFIRVPFVSIFSPSLSHPSQPSPLPPTARAIDRRRIPRKSAYPPEVTCGIAGTKSSPPLSSPPPASEVREVGDSRRDSQIQRVSGARDADTRGICKSADPYGECVRERVPHTNYRGTISITRTPTIR